MHVLMLLPAIRWRAIRFAHISRGRKRWLCKHSAPYRRLWSSLNKSSKHHSDNVARPRYPSGETGSPGGRRDASASTWQEQLTLREIAALLQYIEPTDATDKTAASAAITSTTALSIPLAGILSGTQGLTESAASLHFDPSRMDITAALGVSLNDLAMPPLGPSIFRCASPCYN